MSQDPYILQTDKTKPMSIFESTIFSKNKFRSWKRYYAILCNGGKIHIYKNRDDHDIHTKPITTIDLSPVVSICFSSTSTVNMIKFNIVTSRKTYNLASPHCNTTDAWIKHANMMKNLYSNDKLFCCNRPNTMETSKEMLMTGWLERKPKLKKTWRSNWCTLTAKAFTWYDKNQQKEGYIDLCDIKLIKHRFNTLQIITTEHRYIFSEGNDKCLHWINTFKRILKYSNCLVCNLKDHGFGSMKPLFEGTMTRSVLKKNGKSNWYHYIIDPQLSCLAGFEQNVMNEWKAIIKSSCYDEIVLDELKKNCVDFVDFTVDHEISYIGPFMIIDGIYYECQSKEEMEKWCAWIEGLTKGPIQTVDFEDLCFSHLFLLIDGYCAFNQSVHISYDICTLVMNFVSLR